MALIVDLKDIKCDGMKYRKLRIVNVDIIAAPTVTYKIISSLDY